MALRQMTNAIVKFYVAMQRDWSAPAIAGSNDGHFFLIIRPEKRSLFRNSLVLKHRRGVYLSCAQLLARYRSRRMHFLARQKARGAYSANARSSERRTLFEILRLT